MPVHLKKLLACLSPVVPASLDDLCSDLGLEVGTIRDYIGQIRSWNVELICRRKQVLVSRESWPAVLLLAGDCEE